MARLHAVEPAEVGLADIARGEDYLARQLRRWIGQQRIGQRRRSQRWITRRASTIVRWT